MNIKYVLLFLIIICFQFIYSYVTNNDSLSKEEVLKLRNKFYTSYYCKDDICVPSSYKYYEASIEIPNKNGTLITYIVYTCSYEQIDSNECEDVKKGSGFPLSTLCKSDSECLSNKCYNSHCVFNEEEPIVHCDDIYSAPTFFKDNSSYMYCGKPYGDTCNNNDECSSRECVWEKCAKQYNGPSDSDYLMFSMRMVFIIPMIVIVSLCCCKYFCCRNTVPFQSRKPYY